MCMHELLILSAWPEPLHFYQDTVFHINSKTGRNKIVFVRFTKASQFHPQHRPVQSVTELGYIISWIKMLPNALKIFILPQCKKEGLATGINAVELAKFFLETLTIKTVIDVRSKKKQKPAIFFFPDQYIVKKRWFSTLIFPATEKIHLPASAVRI